jgi:hypothetical protein
LQEVRDLLAAPPTCQRCGCRRSTVVRRSAAAGSPVLCADCADGVSGPSASSAPARSSIPGPRAEVLAALGSTPSYAPDPNRRVSPAVQAILGGR